MKVKKITIDLSAYPTRKELHDGMRSAIGSDIYVGSNLDALNDTLTSICERTSVVLTHAVSARELLGDYADKTVKAFRRAASENPMLTVRVKREYRMPFAKKNSGAEPESDGTDRSGEL